MSVLYLYIIYVFPQAFHFLLGGTQFDPWVRPLGGWVGGRGGWVGGDRFAFPFRRQIWNVPSDHILSSATSLPPPPPFHP